MNLRRRIAALEKQLVSLIEEPTMLFMPDGSTECISGEGDYLLTLFGAATRGECASPEQAAQLELIKRCKASKEPDGAHIVDLIRCFLFGPVEGDHESREAA